MCHPGVNRRQGETRPLQTAPLGKWAKIILIENEKFGRNCQELHKKVFFRASESVMQIANDYLTLGHKRFPRKEAGKITSLGRNKSGYLRRMLTHKIQPK